MATDNRDWYRNWWRKRTGYTERARFRMGADEVERAMFRAAWRRNFVWAAVVVGVVAVVALLR